MRAKRCGSQRWGGGGVFPWNFVRLCSRRFFFFWIQAKFAIIGHCLFRKSHGGQINCKIVLDILQKPPGFHTTAREPKRAHLAPTLETPPKFHGKTPREREKERKWEREKKGRNFGLSGGGGSRGGSPKVEAPKGSIRGGSDFARVVSDAYCRTPIAAAGAAREKLVRVEFVAFLDTFG